MGTGQNGVLGVSVVPRAMEGIKHVTELANGPRVSMVILVLVMQWKHRVVAQTFVLLMAYGLNGLNGVHVVLHVTWVISHERETAHMMQRHLMGHSVLVKIRRASFVGLSFVRLMVSGPCGQCGEHAQ